MKLNIKLWNILLKFESLFHFYMAKLKSKFKKQEFHDKYSIDLPFANYECIWYTPFQTPKSYVIDPIEMMFVQIWIVMFTFWHDPSHYIPTLWHRLGIAKLIGKYYIYYMSYLLVLNIYDENILCLYEYTKIFWFCYGYSLSFCVMWIVYPWW